MEHAIGTGFNAGVLSKLASIFKAKAKRKPLETLPEVYSRFMVFLDETSPSDPNYDMILQAVSLADSAFRAVNRRVALADSISADASLLSEIECFDNLTDDEARQLESLLTRFVSLSDERAQLLEQLSDFNKSVRELSRLEDEAGFAIPQIQEAERHHRALRQDIGYLEGEKADLEYERSNLERGLVFIRWFVVGMVSIFVTVSVLLGYLYILYDRDIFVSASVMAILVIVVSVLLYVFRKRMIFELNMNVRKQNRAVEMLNKKNVLFAYYANYLKFSYKKYRVRSSAMLMNSLGDLTRYKYVTSRIDALRKVMYETQEEIEKQLREKKLGALRSTPEEFARTVNVADRKRRCNELRERLRQTEKELSAVDDRQAEIWDFLMDLDKRDNTDGKIISSIIRAYQDEADKTLARSANRAKAG